MKYGLSDKKRISKFNLIIIKRQGTQISLTKDRLSNLLDSPNQKIYYEFNL